MFVLLTGSALADTPVERLNRFFTQVGSLKARFDQEVFDEKGESVQSSHGSVQLLRPGRFRWHYETPYDQLIVADGTDLWIYDVELQQATVKPIQEALTAAPVRLLTELKPLGGDFIVHPQQPHDGLDWVELEPKAEGAEFQRVDFALDDRGVRQMNLYDHFGQKTVVMLKDLTLNVVPDEKQFRFKPPAGVDVIGIPRGAVTNSAPIPRPIPTRRN